MRSFKRIFITLVAASLILCGCHKEEEEPTKFKVYQIVKEVEAGTTKPDPLTFIRDVNNIGYKIDIKEDTVDTSTLGQCFVTYLITLPDGSESQEMTIYMDVVDTICPRITCANEITLTVGETFDLEKYATASDSFEGDLSNQIQMTGNLDTETTGVYLVVLRVEDSSGNLGTKNVTITVRNDDDPEEQPEDDGSIVGTYMVNYDESKEYNPSLVLSSNGTFTMIINYCTGLQTFTGTYSEEGDTIICISDGFDFDEEDPSSTTVTLTNNHNGTLTYNNAYLACSPIKNDLFVKQ